MLRALGDFLVAQTNECRRRSQYTCSVAPRRKTTANGLACSSASVTTSCQQIARQAGTGSWLLNCLRPHGSPRWVVGRVPLVPQLVQTTLPNRGQRRQKTRQV